MSGSGKDSDMYDLAPDFNEKILIGRFLESIHIGASTTSLLFSLPQSFPGTANTITLAIHGAIEFSTADQQFSGKGEDPSSVTALVSLLLKDVTDVKRIGTASLQIMFNGGGQITLAADESPDLESYTIYIPGEVAIVV
jgi:hypothetical protein